MNTALNLQTEPEDNLMNYDQFIDRHIGPRENELQEMLKTLGCSSLEDFINKAIPNKIRSTSEFKLRDFAESLTEQEALARLKEIAGKNQVKRTYIGQGYYNCFVPAVIQRNILENPGWYTQYTPYQPEISQGRLEALLNYQTMICDLTGLDISNASLLDEGTAAAEAINFGDTARLKYFISENVHPQTIAVVRTRAEALGMEVVFGNEDNFEFTPDLRGVLIQYPDTNGEIKDIKSIIARAKKSDLIVTVACDLLALTLLTPPGELGADVVVGNSQRFGVPYGFGGPHAAFFATKDELKRTMPGRLIGVSKDATGKPALRLALQTREQHIRREKATSNICTAQVLLAIMASMYAVYHGPEGLKNIARRAQGMTGVLKAELEKRGVKVHNKNYFDTLKLTPKTKPVLNVRHYSDGDVGVSLDETTTRQDLSSLIKDLTGEDAIITIDAAQALQATPRTTPFLQHKVFNTYHSETEFLRYLKRLESKDLSLAQSMIPLGSCTMKLNATSEMVPVTWAEFGSLHPFCPADQAQGYKQLFTELERSLCDVTGFAAVSLQPNAGSQGEYAGLLAIKGYLTSQNQTHRNICLIPKSAHGTNPASAAMVGMEVVVTACDEQGNVDVEDLRAKANEHKDNLACVMITYPSTHGVFEEGVIEICKITHAAGGQVYMDGANLNAQVGLIKPAELGADVCHINLHKTFCIPHGGGGPGMGPIAVASHLAPFLPFVEDFSRAHDPQQAEDPQRKLGGTGFSRYSETTGNNQPVVSSAPYGSASILPISWMYMAMMGTAGVRRATEIAILNANYLAKALSPYYQVLYKGEGNYIAHECIFDMRGFKSFGVEVEDIAKRLMDYGFHAPTVSFPVPGTMMVEPTESESKLELDRFIEAMILIHAEIKEIESGKADSKNNLLKNSPHTAEVVSADKWDRPYSRERAAYPTAFTRNYKFWPSVSRIDGVYGDRNLMCSCGSF